MTMFRRSQILLGLSAAAAGTFAGAGTASAVRTNRLQVLGYVKPDRTIVSMVDPQKLDPSVRNLVHFLPGKINTDAGHIPEGAPQIVYNPNSKEVKIVNPNEINWVGRGEYEISGKHVAIKNVRGENVMFPENHLSDFDARRGPNKWESLLRDTLEVLGNNKSSEVFMSTEAIDVGIPDVERRAFFYASNPRLVRGYVDLVPFRKGMAIRQILDRDKNAIWTGPALNRADLDYEVVQYVREYSRPRRRRDVFLGRRPIDIEIYGQPGAGHKTLTYELFENVQGKPKPQKLGTVKVHNWGVTRMTIGHVIDNDGNYIRRSIGADSFYEHYFE